MLFASRLAEGTGAVGTCCAAGEGALGVGATGRAIGWLCVVAALGAPPVLPAAAVFSFNSPRISTTTSISLIAGKIV